MRQELRAISQIYSRALRRVVLAFAAGAGLGIVVMMTVTVCDILSRRLLRHPVPGAIDIIQIACAITMAGALPYTTAVKGHVAVEFLVQRLQYGNRVVVDTIARLLAVGLFGILCYGCIVRGEQLRRVGEVSLTLELPVCWVLYVMGASCAVVVLVIIHNMIHPGREMIKP